MRCRLVEGEIADAVYVRLEGKKAIARMLGERDGTATFAPGAPAIMRRIHESTRTLVDRGASARRARRRGPRRRLASSSRARSSRSKVASADSLSEIDQHVLTRLRVPAVADDILDELPHSDAAILESIVRLDATRAREAARPRVLARAALRRPISSISCARRRRARVRPASRARAARLRGDAVEARRLRHTVLSLADAFPCARADRRRSRCRTSLATIRLGDGVELDVVALPLVPVYAPLWPMALAGAAILVRLDEAAAQSLEEACASVAVPILDARAIFGTLEESSAVQVASLIKTALDADGSGIG